MFFWILFGLLAFLFLAAVGAAILGRNEVRIGGMGAAAVFAVLGAIVFASFSATTVEPRSVGIQTSFGKYVDTLDNGFHWTAPWSSVEEFSTQTQPLDFEVPVSFQGGSSGTAKGTIQWSVTAEGAEQQWKEWKTFDRVRDNVVKPQSAEKINAVVAGYAPQDARNGENREAIQAEVGKRLTDVFGGRGIKFVSVSITEIALDSKAQAAVDRIVEANANTDRAKSEQDRARIEAETATIRQQSLTPEALQRYCLELVNNWDVEKNGNLPATFNCVLGGGNQTPVIVGQ